MKENAQCESNNVPLPSPPSKRLPSSFVKEYSGGVRRPGSEIIGYELIVARGGEDGEIFLVILRHDRKEVTGTSSEDTARKNAMNRENLPEAMTYMPP